MTDLLIIVLVAAAILAPQIWAIRAWRGWWRWLLEEHRRLGGDRPAGQQEARERLGEIVAFTDRWIGCVGPWRRRRHRVARSQEAALGRWRRARRKSGLIV